MAATASLRPLLWLMVAVVVLPITLFGYAGTVTYRTIINDTDANLARNVEVLSEYTLRLMDTVDSGLREMEQVTAGSSATALLGAVDKVSARLGQIPKRLPHVSRVGVLTADGALVASSSAEDVRLGLNRADREYVRGALATDGLFIGRVERAVRSGDLFFAVSRTVEGPEGRRILVAALSPAFILQFLRTLSLGDADQAAIVRGDGRFLVRWPPFGDAVEQPVAARFLGYIAAGHSAEFGTMGFGLSLDGVERRVTYRRVPGYGLYVQAGAEKGSVTRRFLETMSTHLVFGIPATLSLLGLSFLAWRQDRRAQREVVARRAAEEALEQARRMESLGQLTGGVAHDFNNLLMVLQGGLGILGKRITDERSTRQIARMNQAVERGANLTRQLLAFGRRQSLQPTSIDLRTSIDSVAALLRPALPSAIRIQRTLPDGLWMVHADPGELERALLNIGMNARDAMPEGGTLTFSARNVPPDAASAVGLTGSFVQLAVTDTGAGIPDAIQARVFEPFFTTKPRGQGTGLGLSQVYGFAEQSQGRVLLASRAGEGTTVSLFLRRSDAPALGGRGAEASAAQGLPGRSVLLVEDNPDVAAVTGELLGELGLEVATAGDGASGLDLFERAGPFDIVLSDVIMPGEIDGFALANRLAQSPSRPVVVLMSGYTASVDEAERIGIPILRKPFRAAEFMAAVGQRAPGRS